jgi:hypothetical protein
MQPYKSLTLLGVLDPAGFEPKIFYTKEQDITITTPRPIKAKQDNK